MANLSLSREALAWAAGFFDGEGHTRLASAPARKGPAVLTMVISQAGSSELLERFRRAVGVGRVLGPYDYRHRRPTQKPFYSFAVSNFAESQHCICVLWPWLGTVKRAQALAALRQWHEQPRKWFKGVTESRRVCMRGHVVEGDNAYVAKTGRTVCRECHRMSERTRRREKR